MEYAISFVLGIIGSRLQGNWFKNLKINEKTRIRLRYAISFVVCLACGVAVNYGAFLVDGEFDWESLLANVGTAFVSSQTYYNTYFRLQE